MKKETTLILRLPFCLLASINGYPEAAPGKND